MSNTPDVDAIQPALTPEEWAAFTLPVDEWPKDGSEVMGASNDFLRDRSGDVIVTTDWDVPKNPHGLAAALLYGQPFGFTWADVDRCRTIAATLQAEFDDPDAERYDDGALYDEILNWQSQADRIAALLPPRDLVK